jgi:hypothetical protein
LGKSKFVLGQSKQQTAPTGRSMTVKTTPVADLKIVYCTVSVSTIYRQL